MDPPKSEYLGGSNGEPEIGGVEASAADQQSVPGASFLVVVAGFAVAILVLARRG